MKLRFSRLAIFFIISLCNFEYQNRLFISMLKYHCFSFEEISQGNPLPQTEILIIEQMYKHQFSVSQF